MPYAKNYPFHPRPNEKDLPSIPSDIPGEEEFLDVLFAPQKDLISEEEWFRVLKKKWMLDPYSQGLFDYDEKGRNPAGNTTKDTLFEDTGLENFQIRKSEINMEENMGEKRIAMEHGKIYYEIISLDREDNKYNKYLKWVLRTRLRGINEEEEAKLIPLEDRQIFQEWFRTRREAEEKKKFYETFYEGGWGSGSWVPFEGKSYYENLETEPEIIKEEEKKIEESLKKKACQYGDLDDMARSVSPEEVGEIKEKANELMDIDYKIVGKMGIEGEEYQKLVSTRFPLSDPGVNEIRETYLDYVKEYVTEKVSAIIYLVLEDENFHVINEALAYLNLFEPSIDNIPFYHFEEWEPVKLSHKLIGSGEEKIEKSLKKKGQIVTYDYVKELDEELGVEVPYIQENELLRSLEDEGLKLNVDFVVEHYPGYAYFFLLEEGEEKLVASRKERVKKMSGIDKIAGYKGKIISFNHITCEGIIETSLGETFDFYVEVPEELPTESYVEFDVVEENGKEIARIVSSKKLAQDVNPSVAEILNSDDEDLKQAFVRLMGDTIVVNIEPYDRELTDEDYNRISDKIYGLKPQLLEKYPDKDIVEINIISSKKLAQERDKIEEIEERIVSGEDEYFGYEHFHESNMADYTMMSDTIHDMVSVYDILEEEAVEIVSHLTHGDEEEYERKKPKEKDLFDLGGTPLHERASKKLAEKDSEIYCKTETKKEITEQEADKILQSFNAKLDRIEIAGPIYHIYYWIDSDIIKEQWRDIDKAFDGFDYTVRVVSKATKKLAQDFDTTKGRPTVEHEEPTQRGEEEKPENEEIGEDFFEEKVRDGEISYAPGERPSIMPSREKPLQPERNLLKQLTPMDMKEYTSMVDERTRAEAQGDLSKADYMNNAIRELLNKYMERPETLNETSPASFVGRKMKAHTMLTKGDYEKVIKSVGERLTKLRRDMKLRISSASVYRIDRESDDKATVDFALDIMTDNFNSKNIVVRAFKKGEKIDIHPYFWDSLGRVYHFDEAGIKRLFNLQRTDEKIIEEFKIEEKNG